MGEHGRKIRRIIESSEMYCSLRYEDMRGCPFNTFTRSGIAALSGACTALGIISLVIAI